MRYALLVFVMYGVTAWAQNSSELPSAPEPQPNSQSSSAPSSSAPPADSAPTSANKPAPTNPDLSPPRSDSIPASALEDGSSSSKDTQIDLSPPADDAKTHPQGAEAVSDAEAAESARGGGNVSEFHVWDPHKANKDVEIGDFYFRRKNYIAAEDRYREALYYKDNDATATYRLAVCLEKQNRPDEARQAYANYLKILPYGAEAKAAHKAMDRLQASNAKPVK